MTVDFLSGELVEVTEDLLKLNWSGRGRGTPGHPPPGFRCHMCGHQFALGETFRFVLNRKGNALIGGGCCDGPDLVERWEAHVADVKRRAWWAFR